LGGRRTRGGYWGTYEKCEGKIESTEKAISFSVALLDLWPCIQTARAFFIILKIAYMIVLICML